MAKTIAISGKGGSGKTTLAAMLVRLLAGDKSGPVLAVDADPNSTLGMALGVEPEVVVADLREQAAAKKPAAAPPTDRVRSFEYGIQQAVTEAEGFDLLTMGRPEGPGCYCAANNLLREFLNVLSRSYAWVIMDNEAGMEHLSRRTTNNVDMLCVVSEPTAAGIATAERICRLAKQLPVRVDHNGLVLNMTRPGKIGNRKSEIGNLPVLGSIPYDEAIVEAALKGDSIFVIGDENAALAAAGRILGDIKARLDRQGVTG
jgi:CO dehydrogenase maturation factor